MSERPERTPPPPVSTSQLQSKRALPTPPQFLRSSAQRAPSVQPPSAEDEARARIGFLEREAKAAGATPQAAALYYELGLLWESPLRSPRNAATAYQAAFRLAPRFTANLRAARRLFAEPGNWPMVLTLLDAELAATERAEERAPLLFERAQLLEHRLARRDDAVQALRACLALEPQELSLLVQLERAFAERGDLPSAAQTWKLMARAASAPQVRSHCLTQAGLLLEQLSDARGAATLFREAFALHREDPALLAALRRVARREDTPEDEIAALSAEAARAGGPRGTLALRLAKALERAGRPEEAAAALAAALELTPDDRLVRGELARLYDALGQAHELSELLLRWAQTATSEAEIVAVNLQLARLYEEVLRRDTAAAARYRAVLARNPSHAAALSGLGRLCAKLQDWEGLVATYDAEAQAADEPRAKAARAYKAGEALEERLGRVDDAVVRYRQCLAWQPGFLPAQQALARLFEAHGRWADWVALQERELLHVSDSRLQIRTLHRVAEIRERELDDVEGAIDCLRRVLELSDDHGPAMDDLSRLYERAGRWQELVELSESQGRLAADTSQAVGAAHRTAEIVEKHLGDRARAIRSWESVLALAPTYQPALRALGRLYAEEGRWNALVKMYRAEADLVSAPEQAAALLQKIGELYEHRLGAVHEAIAAYREALTLAPAQVSSLASLARIYRRQGDWENLIEILRAEAANSADPHERADAMFQAARLWDERLHKPEQAIEGFREVLRLVADHPAALAQLEELLAAHGDVTELVVVLDRQSQQGPKPERLGAALRLAQLYLDHLHEPELAAKCCETALALEPASLAALGLLERARGVDRARRAELRERIAATWSDPGMAAAVQLSAFDPLASEPPSQAALARLQAASAAAPGDAFLASALERALAHAGDTDGLVAHYRRQAAVASTADDAAHWALRGARLLERDAQGLHEAAACYAEALARAPSAPLPALLGLSRCQLRLGERSKARATLEALAAAAKDPATVQQALLDAALLARTADGDDEAALRLLRRVLEANPLHPDAGRAYGELLSKREAWRELDAFFEARARAQSASGDAAGAASTSFALARLRRERLGDPRGALAAVERALGGSVSADALELKGELALELGDHLAAAAALGDRLTLGGEPQRLAALHAKLAALYQDQLKSPARATPHLQAAIAAVGFDVQLVERLARSYSSARNWSGAADCLRRLLAAERSAAGRARYALALAQVLDEGLAEPAQALEHLRRALEWAPEDPQVLERLVALCERTGNHQELVRVLELTVRAERDPVRSAQLRVRIGALYAGPLHSSTQAVQYFKAALEANPSAAEAWAQLAALYEREPGSTALTLDAHANRLRLEPTAIDSLHALFRAYEATHKADRAFCVAAVLVFFRSASTDEQAIYVDRRSRLPNELKGTLDPSDVTALHHPAARSPLLEVLRAVGDQFSRFYPPDFVGRGVDRKLDRLKHEAALHRAVQVVADALGVTEFDVFQTKQGRVDLETTEPVSVFVGGDLVRRFNAREQRFLLGRGVLGLLDKTAVLGRVSVEDAANILGNAVRIFRPGLTGLGTPNEEQTKLLKRGFSRKALRALEDAVAQLAPEPAGTEAAARLPPPERFFEGLRWSADRAGLLACADPVVGLNLVLRERDEATQARQDTPESVRAAVLAHPELRELVTFALSDELARLRIKLGLATRAAGA